MGAEWMLVCSYLRRRWPGVLVLTLLVGVIGGAVLTAVAGARRTSTSFDRFEEQSRAAHATVNASELDPALLDEVARLPQVDTLGRLAVFFLYPRGALNNGTYLQDPTSFFGSVDGELGTNVDRPRILSGRSPNADAVDEVVISEAAAGALGVAPGDELELRSNAFTPDGDVGPGPAVALTVVGIGRLPSDLAGGPAGSSAYVLLTPAFYEANRNRLAHYEGIARARLRDGSAALPAFTDAVEEIYGSSERQFLEPVEAESAGVDDSIDVLVVGLLLFALAVGVAGAAVVGLALGRQAFAAATEDPVHRALGLRPGQRFAALLAPGLLAAVGGAVIAAVAAYLASPLMPIGIAGRAEPDSGLSVDGVALGAGTVAVAVAVVALAALAAWRALRFAPTSTGATWSAAITGRLARAGLGPAPVTGVRLALTTGRGRTAVPVRAALLGTAVGLAGVVAVVVFGASLNRLLDMPGRYGWTWDVTVDVPEAAESRHVDEDKFADELKADPN
ncbi:MAG: ABC transporter permease, partial [Candidatus Rokuibacteriota bacterium]